MSRIPIKDTSISINALEDESIINNPGDVNQEILEYLREVSENLQISDEPQPSTSGIQNLTPKRKIIILEDKVLKPPDQTIQTIHSNNEETENDGIKILDEIINNKSRQLLIKPNAHDTIETNQNDFKTLKITEVKIPKFNKKLIFEFLRDFTSLGTTIYLYFFDDEQYKIFNDVYMKNFSGKGLKLIKCTKIVNYVREKGEQVMLIKFQHEGKCNHRGIQETLEKLKRNYYWPGMKTDITDYINNCEICQVAKYARNPPYVPLVLTETPTKPFEILHIDTFKYNNQVYLTIIDKFSKLGQALQLKGTTAIEVCNALTNFFTFYGIPTKITSDQGTEFNNDTVKELLQTHGIKIHFTTPSHHESNSPVERFHSTLIEHLRLLKEKHGDDQNMMKYAIIAYNSSIHSTTNFTPHELVFGHTTSRDPLELLNSTFYSEYVSNHRDKVESIYKNVKETSENIKQKIIDKRNEKGPDQIHFKIDQIVYKSVKGRNKKTNKFMGPYKLIKFLENNKVNIQNCNNKNVTTVHIKELRKPSAITGSSASSSETQNIPNTIT